MKISKLIYLFIICFAIYSCDDDDSVPGDGDQGGVDNFFPLVIGNSWDYENVFTTPDEDDIVANETLSVVNSETVGASIEYDLDSDNPANSGPVTSALIQGTLKKSDDQLIFTGTLGFEVDDFPGLDLALDNAPIYDLSASSGTELYSNSGSTDETIEDVPITLDYEIKTVMGESLNSYTVNGTTYNDVIHSQIILTLEIKAVVFLEITVLPEQDVVVLDNYFAKDIGMISSETEVEFDFIEIDQIPLPIQDIMLSSTQSLESYDVELE